MRNLRLDSLYIYTFYLREPVPLPHQNGFFLSTSRNCNFFSSVDYICPSQLETEVVIVTMNINVSQFPHVPHYHALTAPLRT